MQPTILVTGAPGNVGTAVVQQLLAAGRTVRVAALDIEEPRRILGDGPEYVRFAFGDPSTYPPAFAGIRRFFLLRPPQIADVRDRIKPVVDYAATAGVEQVVFLSLLGVERNPFVPHYKIEQYIRAAGLPYTFLRPTYFMQNFSTTYREMIRSFHEIGLPTGKGRMSLIDARDVAAVAAKALTEAGHEYRAYTLTGREAPDLETVARTFSEVLGREIRFTNPSIRAYRRRMAEMGFALALINVTTMMYLIARLGLSATITPEIEQLLGRPPISLAEFVRDYAHLWQ